MRNLDKRLDDLERRLAPAKKFVIYQESLEEGERDMFRRMNPPGDGSLLTHDQVAADAGDAVVILIVYESRPVEPQPGFLADVPAQAGPSIPFEQGPVIWIPNNHRGDLAE